MPENVKPDISLNYDYRFEINTTPESDTATMAEVAKGFDNVSEALNEVLYQGSFLGDGGYGSSFVTGGQLIVTLSGVRMVGDPAQDYMFGDAVYYNWGKARETDIRMYCPDGAVITCPVTLAKITRSGGAANNATAVSLEIHFNGKPEVVTETE
ncbi:MAG: capsid protein [Ruminococcus sp.]|nr:capsid protein [Ruminococcus sp.]